MPRYRRFIIAGGLIAIALSALPSAARAHPLGNDSITHFNILYLFPDRIEVDLILDFAETPALVLRRDEIDADHDGQDTPEERQAWLARKADILAAAINARLNDQPIPLHTTPQAVDPRTGRIQGKGMDILQIPGVAGMPTYKVVLRLIGPYPAPLIDRPHRLDYEDRIYPAQRGLMRILLERPGRLSTLNNPDADLRADLDAGRVPDALPRALRLIAIDWTAPAAVHVLQPGSNWALQIAEHHLLIEAAGPRITIDRLPRVVVDPPHPPFWDEEAIHPLLYEQYDPANLPQIRSTRLQFRVEQPPPSNQSIEVTVPGTRPALPAQPLETIAATTPADIATKPTLSVAQAERPAATDTAPEDSHPTTAPTLATDPEPATATTTEPTAGPPGYLAMLSDPRNDPARSPEQRNAQQIIDLLRQPWGFAALASVTLLCFVWGAAHALMPGHAKTLVAAYLISQHGRAWHAVLLAVIVTCTHTALVVLLGLVIWIYQRSHPTLGGTLQLWLGALAGLLVAGMGAVLIRRACAGHPHGHTHDHPHHPHLDHDHHHDHHEPLPWWKKLFTHQHAHPHGHDHESAHPPDHAPHPHGHAHPHPHPAPASGLTTRSLVLMGITGGIVPCPTATIILLLGIGANVVAGALYAVAVFSLGLALTLMTIGLLALTSRRAAAWAMTGDAGEQHLRGSAHWLLTRLLPALSGVAVLALGAAIALHYFYLLRTGTALFEWIR